MRRLLFVLDDTKNKPRIRLTHLGIVGSHPLLKCKNLYSKAIEKGVGMGDHTDNFGGSGQYLIVLVEAAGMIEPGKRTFYDPAPGKLLPFVRLDFLRNVNTTPQSPTGIKCKSPPVSRIGAKAFNGWIPLTCLLCRHVRGIRVSLPWFYHCPLCICQVARVRLPHRFFSCVYFTGWVAFCEYWF